MNRDQIVSALFTGQNFNKALQKMEPDYLREDLKQEVFTIICSWTSDMIIGLHERKQLDFYVIRVMLNQIQSSTSPFFKKYRRGFAEIQETWAQEGDATFRYGQGAVTKKITGLHSKDFLQCEEEMDDRINFEKLETEIILKLDTLPWYDCEMVKLYLKCGSFMKMQQMTGIPKPSCYQTVKRAFRDLSKLKHNGQPKAPVSAGNSTRIKNSPEEKESIKIGTLAGTA